MFDRDYINVEKLWHIYIIKLDNNGKKPNRYCKYTTVYYTGITCRGIGKRFGDYWFGRGGGYVNNTWKDATRELKYVEYFYGTEYEAMTREREIKKMGVKQKEELIDDMDKNKFKMVLYSKRNEYGFKFPTYIILSSQLPIEETYGVKIK